MQGVNEWKPYRPTIRKKTQETEKRRKSETSHLRTLSRAAQGAVCVCVNVEEIDEKLESTGTCSSSVFSI